MRGIVGLGIALLVVAAGCAGPPKTGSTSGPGGTNGTGGTHAMNTTEDVLLAAPHLKILGPATVQWDLNNASQGAPEVTSTLMYFGLDVKSGLHARDNGILLVAFIPVNVTDVLGSCGEMPTMVRHYSRLDQSGGGGGGNNNNNDDEYGNLTGMYTRGWYHVIVVADNAGSFSISFDAEKEMRNRKLPAADPFVTNLELVSFNGTRDATSDLDAKDGYWLAWSHFQVGGNGGGGGGGGGGFLQVDGGRTLTLGFNGDCAKATTTTTNAFLNQGNTVRTRAGGAPGSVKAEAHYTPTQSAAAPSTSLLRSVIVGFQKIEVPAAPATSAPAA